MGAAVNKLTVGTFLISVVMDGIFHSSCYLKLELCRKNTLYEGLNVRIQNILSGLKLRNQVGMSGFGLIFDK